MWFQLLLILCQFWVEVFYIQREFNTKFIVRFVRRFRFDIKRENVPCFIGIEFNQLIQLPGAITPKKVSDNEIIWMLKMERKMKRIESKMEVMSHWTKETVDIFTQVQQQWETFNSLLSQHKQTLNKQVTLINY